MKTIALTPEQMQVLIDKGLDCSNSSFIWADFNDQKHEWELLINNTYKGLPASSGAEKTIPAFSLQDMLDILRDNIKYPYVFKIISNTSVKPLVQVSKDSISTIVKVSDNFIDAAYQMLLWLIDNKHIKTNSNA